MSKFDILKAMHTLALACNDESFFGIFGHTSSLMELMKRSLKTLPKTMKRLSMML